MTVNDDVYYIMMEEKKQKFQKAPPRNVAGNKFLSSWGRSILWGAAERTDEAGARLLCTYSLDFPSFKTLTNSPSKATSGDVH